MHYKHFKTASQKKAALSAAYDLGVAQETESPGGKSPTGRQIAQHLGLFAYRNGELLTLKSMYSAGRLHVRVQAL